MKQYTTIVVGGGQAGLSAGYFLQQHKSNFVILDMHEQVGDSWRERYDSLTLFSPRFCNRLPGGEPMPGPRHGFPTKDEMADYLSEYARRHDLPVQTNCTVQQIKPTTIGYELDTSQGKYHTESIILATGGFSRPYIPPIAQQLSDDITQLHSTDYHNPSDIDRSGSVVVVGAGNSGVQIAAELIDHLPVYFVYRRIKKWIPNSWILWRLMQVTGILTCKSGSWIAELFRENEEEPILGISKTKFFADPNLIDAGPMREQTGPRSILCKNQTITDIATIIRATGFQQDRSWTGLDGLTDQHGHIIQDEGVTPLPGIYVLGLPWMRQKGSATVGGVKVDAKKIVHDIISPVSAKAKLDILT